MKIYGAKRQKQSSNKPYIQKDTASSTNSYQALYGLSEGEIYGLVDGGKSIRLDGTPIINDNGEPNFPDVSWDFRAGSIDQTHIKGFSSVENEQSVNVELRHDRPYTKAINNKQLSAVAIRLGFNSLREQKGNGDVVGYRIEYAIDVQTDGGAWEMVLNTAVDDKVSQGYQRSHRIDLPKAQQGWSVRVRRLTPNRDSEMVSDTMVVSAVTEIIDAKLRYPCTALLALKYDAQTFSNIAKVAVHVRGMLIQVPTNYDPTARAYDGLWDGTFKLAYTNNPAWVFYDICTAKRYGLGDRLAGKVDKWSLYRLAQYCDEMVDDGKGGKEPRFTVNVYLQKADDAYRVLQNLASVFRALSFWDGTSIVVDADTPKEPVYVFSNANVIGGEFSYTGTRARDRHTIVKCAYDDPDNNFETDYIYVQDEHAIAKYGINQLELNLFGCTSKGQAQRAGIWALKSEQLETETVSFSTGLDGFIPKVGEIIHVQDNSRAGRMQAGRIVATDGRQITLDRMAGKVGDTLMVGDNSAQIVQIDDTVITTDTAIGRAGQVFAISSSDVAPRAYRVMTISQNDDASFSFTALQYEIGKFTATNNIAAIPKKEVSVIKAHVLTPPNSVGITERTRTHQGQAITTLVISWEQVVGAVAYIVEYKKDSNAWQTHKVSSHSLEIDGVYAGVYQAKVRAIDAFDNESLATSSQLTQITGKQGKPPRPINLSVQGVLFGMNLGWNFAKGSGDTNYTEIQVSPDGRSNIATLGTFAYPTNKHEITGLQGNLTQFYRARIVDKLGNTSDWTDWVSGTTSANADKVLDILSGQISQSHLDQSLRTPIGKIGTIESNISKINVDLPDLNQSIADAQSTLNTAVASIDTEKKRLSSAIVDINTLKQSNNAKTQEIANLTQTVSGHTSQVRELGVTTGDLSQKYSQVKTQADNAASEITAVKQTQSGQATSVERIRSEMANKASTASVNSLTESLANKEQALSRRIRTVESTASGNTSSINTLNQSLTDKERALTRKQEQLTAQLANKASVASINTLNQSLTDKERALTTKQEQLTAQLANKASTASVNSLSESLASKERALTEQINRAKSEIGGRITQISNETRTLTDANRTIGERINQLNSELAGADSISDNLLINSNRTLVTGAYLIATYRISETLKNGDKVRLTVNAPQLGSRRIGFMAYNSNSASGSKLSDIRNRQGNSYTAEFEWNVGTGANNELWLYHNAENTRSVSTITSVSLQKITTSSGLASIKSSVANLERTLTTTNQSLAERINTVQTTLNGQTASIQQHAQSLNGLSAQWTLKVQSGGVVSGIGLASNNGVSDFAVRADKFYVASPQGNKKPMFSVITRPTTLNGTTVPTGVYLNGDLLASGTISGDKIRANTQITAPNIRGGSINIGSNFSVDSQGNLNANSGVFRGQVFADKITGQIDVESLKSSAVALGYDMFISNSYHASSPSGFDKTFKASYPSHGSIIQSLGFNNENIGSAMYEMRVFCKRAITVKQKLHTVDDNLYCYVNGDSAFGYHSNYDYYDNEERVPTPFGRGRINTEISLSLRQGLNTIQFVLNNSGGGICQLIVLGDFIDNNIIKFA
ncbi:TipJ family phage tail tip protein [Moraxella catarrhalis]|uniref:TipJ family phage tail tip protein n=3 Tax=Moraxella catarrhalis TaxID=480 RepID=UPI000665221D|nr:phage tail protein [Moraxella catarrhalis]